MSSGGNLISYLPQPFWGKSLSVFPVCDPLLLPHLSLAANTQLLGYLSRAPIKGCHSGLQCAWANHIRAPAHAQPLLCCSSPAMLITFKYFHRWPVSCLRGEQQHESKLMFEEPKLTSIYVNTNKRQNHWIRKLSQCLKTVSEHRFESSHYNSFKCVKAHLERCFMWLQTI